MVVVVAGAIAVAMPFHVFRRDRTATPRSSRATPDRVAAPSPRVRPVPTRLLARQRTDARNTAHSRADVQDPPEVAAEDADLAGLVNSVVTTSRTAWLSRLRIWEAMGSTHPAVLWLEESVP